MFPETFSILRNILSADIGNSLPRRQNSLPRNRENLAPTPASTPYEVEPRALLHWSKFIKVQDCEWPAPAVPDNCRNSDRTGARAGIGMDASAYRNAIHFEGQPLEETLSSLKDNERNLEGRATSRVMQNRGTHI